MENKTIKVFRFQLPVTNKTVVGLQFDNPEILKQFQKRLKQYGKGIPDPGGWLDDFEAWYVDKLIWPNIRPHLAKHYELAGTDDENDADVTAQPLALTFEPES